MTQEEFNILIEKNQAHKVFKTDWNVFYSLDFADTLLPDVPLYQGKALWMFDGAGFFGTLQKTPSRTLSIEGDGKLINLIGYTYPKGVQAEEVKNNIQPADFEICMFAEVEQNDTIEISFAFGKRFKDYLKNTANTTNAEQLENKTYPTTTTEFKSFFNNKLVHEDLMRFVLETIGVEITHKTLFIEKCNWLNENNQIIEHKKSKENKDILFSNIHFGEKVSFLVSGKQLKPDLNISITIGLLDENKKFINDRQINFRTKVKDTKIQTPFFIIPYDWYDESKETYNYQTHQTTVNESDLTRITAKIEIGKNEFFIEDHEQLIPDSYRRNYEELIGLYKKEKQEEKENNQKTENKNEKSKTDNYENYFISLNKQIKTVVDDFEKFIYQTPDLTLKKIIEQVEQDARKLWLEAIKQVQDGALDDRPLYWARNKMQATLKRHPLFKEQLDLEKSIANKDAELEQIITLFEELSRNYTGVDFSESPTGVKKILITGFDPFFLNEKHPVYGTYSNFRQSNPSGCVALALHNTLTPNGLGFIQTMIVPVRYTDFDSSKNQTSGQGEGIVEKYIKPWLDEVDMIITVSQAGPDDYNIDVFATATRGGLIDNLGYERVRDSRSISSSSKETIVTTLLSEFTQNPSEAIFYGKYFQTKEDEEDFYRLGDTTKQKDSNTNTYPTSKVFSGPGGNYLSNEIFYRVAKLREEWIAANTISEQNPPTKSSGHFHIAKLQDESTKEDFSASETQNLLNKVIQAINKGVTGL